MIKEFDLNYLLEQEDYMIILDTNILLNYYRLECFERKDFYNILKKLSKYIVIPSTVSIEFEKLYRDVMNTQMNSISLNRINKSIVELKKETNYCLQDIEKQNYINFKKIKTDLIQLLEQTNEFYKRIVNKFENDLFRFAKEIYSENDFYDYYKALTKMPALEHKELYDLGREAEQRFEKKFGPGYKDNGKESYRKYNDYYIWFEIKRYSKINNKNLILVTNDLKSDWYDKKDDQYKLSSKLEKEFYNETSKNIIALPYQEFYNHAIAYNIITKRISNNILQYINSISDKVFYEIEYNLFLEIENYLFEESLIRINYLNSPGSEGFNDIEVNNFSLSHYSFKQEKEKIVYSLFFNVEIFASSKEYWGRDEDDHEPYYSPESQYTLKGDIEVEVIRNLKEFENNDNHSFVGANIIKGELHEVNYTSWIEEDYEDIYY